MLAPYYQETLLEAGCDEAGRGCYAGPVFAAAVILPPGFNHPLLNDSKQVKAKDRYALRSSIEENALAWAVGKASEEEIDRINILQASWLAMHRAIEALQVRPGLLLIDGNRFRPYPFIQHQCIIKGDSLYRSIAAASILAKTYRDDHMLSLHQQFPQYGWKENKGYGTKIHRQAIEAYGLCVYHRKSFQIDPAKSEPVQ
ncbi:ribonuclease HII [Flavihumibacter fluvii]|uniref:ribonuclease HII n=1 Tax=Flavihumibacter fluvii TaxID=2838157 RepID=UPI001BDE5B8C|nr:ribonuclease HII [Flavihumibacter fluvii]ULQ51543.1 ribonuclease HII [Flavihumibacter fluvii]